MGRSKYKPDIHKRNSIRLKGYDYSQEGLYFITICVKDKECLFGEIENDKMVLNENGKIVENCWFEIPKHYPKVVLHEFIVMPNHFHGIIEIVNTNNVGANDYSPCTGYLPYAGNNTNTFNEGNNEIINNTIGNNLLNIVGTNNYLPYVGNNERANNHSPLQKNGTSKTIGAIVRGLKIGITKQIGFSVFQRNYYEHIVRDENSYYKIVEYIENNVLNWEEDRFYEK